MFAHASEMAWNNSNSPFAEPVDYEKVWIVVGILLFFSAPFLFRVVLDIRNAVRREMKREAAAQAAAKKS
jgi:hypothetical protein